MGGWQGWVDGPPTVTSPHIGQTQRHGEKARQLGWEPAGKPETLPAVPSIHHDVPLFPLAPSQAPSSDATRAVTALSHHGRAGDRLLRLASTGRQRARQVARPSVAESSPWSIGCAESGYRSTHVRPPPSIAEAGGGALPPLCLALRGGKLAGMLSCVHCYGIFFLATFYFFGSLG